MATVKPAKVLALPVKIYLVLYNALQFFGWTFIGTLAIRYLINHKVSSEGLWNNVELPLLVFQTLAALEVIHSAVRIVPSSAGVTLVQVFSRVFLLWPILYCVPESRDIVGFPMLLTAWILTEVLRYLYYTLSLVNSIPAILKWCRYSFFVLLYPIGITGELLCCYRALPHYNSTKKFSIFLPNAYNVSFNFWILIVVIMALYVPVFPQLYGHMFSQRRKILGATSKKLD